MTVAVAWRIARRELRGGLRGFRVFLACLALGVAAIAAVGMVRAAIEAGLRDQGAVILGGDAQMEFTYRYADADERAWMDANFAAVSEIVDFRSMAVSGPDGAEERGLTQVKAVDDGWPLLGEARMDPPMTVAQALAPQDGLPGAAMDRVLADRMGLAPGDRFRLGLGTFRLSAILVGEPDSAAGGFGLGPRTLVRAADLEGSGLIGPGSLYETKYRLLLRPGDDLDRLREQARAAFDGKGMRWSDSRRAAPGVERFVDRMGAFLVLVGLAGLAVGGVGVSAAVRAYLEGKIATIATLKTLGAEGRTIFAVYLMQVGVLTCLGVAAGLVLGAGVPMLLAPVLTAVLPLPVVFAVYPAPLAEAAFYGVLTALIFTLWPLARSEKVRAAALYRGGDSGQGRPRAVHLAVLAGLVAVLVGGAAILSGVPDLALWSAAGIMGALGILMLAALLLRRLARRAARSRAVRGRTGLRLALSAIGGPRDEAASVILSLGLGLSVLAAVGQIDANLRAAIDRDLPERAPSYFFVDIQPDQIDGFRDRLARDPAVSNVESAPMLRGIITRINGQDARSVAGDHWVLRGDRGVTYADRPPPNTTVTAGAWWPEGHDGPPQVSFAAEEAAEIGLRLGDRITVNILGRDIEAQVTSFRVVDFSTAGIGFVMAMNPNALAGAPHTHIATVYAEEQAEAAILRDLARAYPNITAVRVRDAIDQVTDALTTLANATAWAAAATLVTGFVVLIGAAAAGERGRVFESAVLKTLGATRARILGSFAMRAALTGAAAGIVAIGAGALAGWAVMTFVMEARYAFEPVSAVAIVAGGVIATLAAGLAFALRPLAARPAQVLRAVE
ncbi:MAG: FtsX-like permease family protein [Paracoccaceae bacterium]|nr:MAG: FtsX-like permease family protein [Paracoccaceae bacterium]